MAQHRVAARAKVGRADEKIEGAVLVHLDAGCAHVHLGHAGALHQAAHAQTAAVAARFRLPGGAPAPVDFFGADLNAIRQGATADGHRHALLAFTQGLKYGRAFTRADVVQLAEFHGVHANGFGHFIHQAFRREECLGGPKTTVGATHRHVGVGDLANESNVVRAIKGQHLAPAAADDGEAVAAVGTCVGGRLHAEGGDATVLLHTHAQADPDGMPGAAGAEILLPGELPEDGALGAQGQHGDHIFQQHLLLAAETTADAGFDDADLLDRDLQALRDDAPAVERHLGAGDDDDASAGVEVGLGDVGLDRGVLGVLGFIGAVELEVSLGQALVKAAHFHADVGHKVLQRFVGHGDGNRGVRLIMDDGSAFREGFINGEHGFQHLVLDLDRLDGSLRLLQCLGGHGSDPIAHVADLGVEHEGVVGRRFGIALTRCAVRHPGHVAVIQDRFHAGHLFRRADVDGDDPCMGVGAPQHLHVECVRWLEVSHVGGFAKGQGHGIDLDDRLVDDFQILHVHFAPPQEPAAITLCRATSIFS